MGSYAAPASLGFAEVNAAGSMTIVLGVLLLLAAVFGPRYGVLATTLRRAAMARRIALDDLLGRLYRDEESGRPVSAGAAALAVVARARRLGLVRRDAMRLTTAGRERATDVVRRHRLWETYLVERAGLAGDHVHAPAERLEHLLDALPPQTPEVDPHGRPIPGADDG